MPDAPIAAQIHQALDAHCDFAAQITFDREPRDRIANIRHVGLTQVFDLRCRIDSCACAHGARARSADAVHMRERDPNVLIDGDIDPCDSCHRSITLEGLALTLLVARIRAYDTDDAVAANDFAITANFSD